MVDIETRLTAILHRLKPTGKKPKPMYISGEDRELLFKYIAHVGGLVKAAQDAAAKQETEAKLTA